MALCGVCVNSSLERVEFRCLSANSSSRQLINHLGTTPMIGKFDPARRRCFRVTCEASRSGMIWRKELGEDGKVSIPMEDEDLGPATKFATDDFVVSDRVSTGLGGRTDEVVFEAIVKNPNSPLYNMRVVLRELTSVQAQRRGKRAIEVLRKLARRRLLYHSYSMQVHGYVSSSTSGDSGSFTLVHGEQPKNGGGSSVVT